MQRFGRVPPPGVHPRVLISPDQLPALRRLMQTTEVGKLALGRAEAFLGTLHNPANGLGAIYDGLLKGDPNAISRAQNPWWNHLVPLALAVESYDDLLRQNQARGRQAASALATLASIPRDWSTSGELLFLALAYDFDYPYMTPQQRNIVRQTIAKNTAGKKAIGSTLPHDWRNSNGLGAGTYAVLSALAIEGEPGYDASIYPASLDIMRDFLHYGITSTGGGLEEMHYFNFGMDYGAMAMVAFARHGDDLFSDPHYRALPNWLVASMEPFGDAFSTHQDTPNDSGGLASNYAILKWIWPNDPIVDMVWRNIVDANQNFAPEYYGNWFPILVYPSDPVGWHPYTGKVPRTKWGVTPWAIPPNYPDPVRGIEALRLPLTYWDPQRGLLITRDKWGSNGMVLSFDLNTQAIGGGSHYHSNSTMFTLSALQRKWAIDRGFHVAETKDSSNILIDGRGQAYPPVGGVPVEYKEAPGLTIAAGDASRPYDWIIQKSIATGAPFEAAFHWKPDTDPQIVRLFAELASVNKAQPWLDNTTKTFYLFQAPYNPVQKAFRTVALRRDAPHPYVLIVDDIRKDNASHQYDWLMPLADDLVLKSTNGGSVILGSSDAKDKRRLLVQMVSVQGGGSWTLEKYQVKRTPESLSTESLGTGLRLRYTVHTVEPNFKVLLYPYLDGSPLPQAIVRGKSLTVRWPDQQDSYSLTPLPTGRTAISLTSR